MPTVADALWRMLAGAGVRRCYGIVGDALNPVIDALRRGGDIDFVRVRHEEWGVFAAVAALSRPAHVPVGVAKGFTLSVAKQALSGHLGEVAKEAVHNVRLL